MTTGEYARFATCGLRWLSAAVILLSLWSIFIAASGAFVISNYWIALALGPSMACSLIVGAVQFRFEKALVNRRVEKASRDTDPEGSFRRHHVPSYLLLPILTFAFLNLSILAGVPVVVAQSAPQAIEIEATASPEICARGGGRWQYRERFDCIQLHGFVGPVGWHLSPGEQIRFGTVDVAVSGFGSWMGFQVRRLTLNQAPDS